ncbi:hypothetical protein EV363DRAFT_1359775 [Boletus edulis]|nr:hypothetical protein EV363DRAFT_1359775 [Boletus edulis]
MICASHAISFVGLLALAVSLPLSERDAFTSSWAPKITYPTTGVEWCVGATHHVYWDASYPPPTFDKTYFKLTLVAHDDVVNPDHPLAQGFSFVEGGVIITVPSVPAGKYEVDLASSHAGEGWSQPFDIKDC